MSTPTLQYAPPGTPRRVFEEAHDFSIHAATSQVQGLKTSGSAEAPTGFIHNVFKKVLATAAFRCWHFIVFFTAEACVVTYLHQHGVKDLAIQNTLMGVLGTVLGFVISYRSSSAFDRYNEGRKYWSQIVYNIRMFSRVVWYNLPDEPSGNVKLEPAKSTSEFKARALVEKKTVLNLLLAFAVSLKHYLRGEEGSHYEDLYNLVKFLPAYQLPAGIAISSPPSKDDKPSDGLSQFKSKTSSSSDGLPLHTMNSSLRNRTTSTVAFGATRPTDDPNVIYLAPARNPPRYHIFDFWPMSLFVRSLQKRGTVVKGRKALRDRAQKGVDGNIPLEVSLYLSSYIASMQKRGADSSSCSQMSGTLGQMVDALTGLERILHTPIPFSYAVHLWTVTLVWLVALPFQILDSMGWLTIPGTALAAFVYCGLMKSAEELENPFGYDYNDLNLDHFTHNIIRKELQALTSLPMPDPINWAFSPDNDAVFDQDGNAIYLCNDSDIASPNEWVQRGEKDIRTALNPNSDSEKLLKAEPSQSTASTSSPVPTRSRQSSSRNRTSSSVPVPPPVPGQFSNYSKRKSYSSSIHTVVLNSSVVPGATVETNGSVETADPSTPAGQPTNSNA